MSLRLKDYQDETLTAVDRFVAALAKARAEDAEMRVQVASLPEHMRARLLDGQDDPAIGAWKAAQAAGVTPSPDPWRALADGHARQVPHVCLQLPTGSGKTLIAGHAVGRILTGLDAAMTGFVLWVVPSDAIYKQTRGAMRDRGHALRQSLEAASGGRLKLLEKGDDFTRADVENGLAVMLLMLQSARLPRPSSESKVLKVFRTSGRYASFFPEGDDRTAAAALKARVPNIETHDLADGAPGAVVQSLGNTLRLVRPIMVLDEGHSAYSAERRRLLGTFNPRFLLELTATPEREMSNILVKVGGKRLRDAEMIKLPIELVSDEKAHWTDTLKAALDKRAELEADALKHDAAVGRADGPIRPIMLVRVERTGRDQRDGVHIHTEDVRETLLNELNVPAEWVKAQTATEKELSGELMDATCQTRVIITKDALREGWDCPFAYVLALLSKTSAKRALTQMIGRVLRQPDAKRTGVDALDSAWVFCSDLSVKDAVEGVRDGLDEEGMGDLKGQIRGGGVPAETRTVDRRDAHKGARILIPRVTHDDGKGVARELDFEADILGAIDWSMLRYEGGATLTLDGAGARRARARFDYVTDDEVASVGGVAREALVNEVDRPDLARRLLGVVPNPWVGIALVDEALTALRAREIDEGTIAKGRLDLVADMREALAKQVDALARAVFERKLADGVIRFRLRGLKLDWEMPTSIEVPWRPGADSWEHDNDGYALGRTLFRDGIKRGELNEFERNVALYLDGNDAIAWWWRLTSRGDWGLQGWRRHKVYPDFLMRLSGDGARFHVLETKGQHLENDDTASKRALMEALGAAYTKPSAGEVELFDESPDAISFQLLMQNEAWSTDLAADLRSATNA